MTTSTRRSATHAAGRLASDLRDVSTATGPVVAARYAVAVARSLPEITRTGTLGPADAGMAGRRWTFRVLGTTVSVPGELFGGGREMYARRVYFPRAIAAMTIRPGDVVVDLGANHGLFTTLAARLAARVLAVEAQSEFIPLIEENVRRNPPAAQVTVEHALVGERTGVVADPGWSAAATHFGTPPPVVGMEKLLGAHDLTQVDFLKVDIEGSEFALFDDGAAAWLPRVRRIAMEVHTDFGDPAALRDQLGDAGFATILTDNEQRPASALTASSGYLYAWRLPSRATVSAGV